MTRLHEFTPNENWNPPLEVKKLYHRVQTAPGHPRGSSNSTACQCNLLSKPGIQRAALS